MWGSNFHPLLGLLPQTGLLSPHLLYTGGEIYFCSCEFEPWNQANLSMPPPPCICYSTFEDSKVSVSRIHRIPEVTA